MIARFIAGLALVAVSLAGASVPPVFENSEIKEVLDLTAGYTRCSLKIIAKNIADSPASEYVVAVPVDDAMRLSAVECEDDTGPLHIAEAPKYETEDSVFFTIQLRRALPPGESVEINVGRALINKTQPYPFSGKQDSPQLLVYRGSRTIYSAYNSKSQTLIIKTPTEHAVDLEESSEDVMEASVEAPLKFGPFEDVEPYTLTPLTLQYLNPLPQIHFPSVRRSVWVSHWGDAVSFDESYDLVNTGTRLKGPFSRLDYTNSNGMNLNQAAVRNLPMGVPSPARDLYYVDLVGNVSTSRFKDGREARLQVSPRYPVLGGWHYNFTIGWTNPLGLFVHKVGGSRYTLMVPLLNGPNDASYDEVVTKIILPEGAKNVEVTDVYGVEPTASVVYSYLDLRGRLAYEVVHRKLVSDHRAGMIVVTYDYTLIEALRKPLVIATAIFAVFVAAFYGTKIRWAI